MSFYSLSFRFSKILFITSPAEAWMTTSPGLRKSGIPDSVLTPAPVKTITFRELRMRSVALRMSFSRVHPPLPTESKAQSA